MSPIYELLLLQLISRKGDVSVFIHQGFTYSQIFGQIKIFEDSGFAVLNREAGTVEITAQGMQRMQEINQSLGRTNSSAWISPLYDQMVKKIKVEEVYLPKRQKPR